MSSHHKPRKKIKKSCSSEFTLRNQKPVEKYKREVEEQLKFLMEHQFTEADTRLRKSFQIAKDGDKVIHSSYKARVVNKYNYVKGVLDLVYTINEHFDRESPLVKHMNFLFVLGLSYEQILYVIFTMGYINVSLHTIKAHFLKPSVRKHLEQLRKEYMAEVNLLKKKVFQDLAGEVMLKEKKHLESLLNKIHLMQVEFDRVDPINEFSRYNRLRKQIDEALKSVKDMHGIDAYREALVKTEAAITVQNNNTKGPSHSYDALPQPEKHPELEDSRIITLKEEEAIVTTANEL